NGRPRRKRRAAETRRIILRAARDLISNRGYAGVSLDDIAAAAGVSRQTLYLQFGSKVGLLTALMEEDEASGLREFRATVDNITDPLELLRTAIPADTELIRKNHKLMRVCYAQAVNDPDFQAFWAYRMNKRRTNMRRA